MNLFDLLVLLFIALSLIWGVRKGLIHEVFALVGVFLGILVALILSPQLTPHLERWIPYEAAAYAVAFVLFFFITMLVTGMIANVLTKALDVAHLGFYNRLLGGVFGLLRGVIIGLIMAVVLTLFLDSDSPVLTESRITPRLAWGARTIAPLLPDDIRDVLLNRLDDLPSDEAEEII